MEGTIYGLIQQINGYPQWCVYLFTYISGWLQVVFPPYPGEVILALNGCVQSGKPLLLSLSLFFTYWLSIVSANLVLFELGYRKGVALLRYAWVRKFISIKNNEKIQRLIDKYGFFIFLIAIYIPGMYLPLVFFSGVMKYKRRNALIGIMLATWIHDILLFLGGRFIGNNLNDIISFITIYRTFALCIVLGAAITAFVLYMIYKNKSQDTDTNTDTNTKIA